MKVIKDINNFVRSNRVGLVIGTIVGFVAAKILFWAPGMGRQEIVSLADKSSYELTTGALDNWLLQTYDPQTVVFIKLTILLVLVCALVGAYTDSVVD